MTVENLAIPWTRRPRRPRRCCRTFSSWRFGFRAWTDWGARTVHWFIAASSCIFFIFLQWWKKFSRSRAGAIQTYNLCSAIAAYSDHSFFPVCGSFHFKPVFVCIFTVMKTGLKMKGTTYREKGNLWICCYCGAQIICLLGTAPRIWNVSTNQL